jgi:hypothetical protein
MFFVGAFFRNYSYEIHDKKHFGGRAGDFFSYESEQRRLLSGKAPEPPPHKHKKCT